MSTTTTGDLLGPAAAGPAARASAATSLRPRRLVLLLLDISWSIARRAEAHRLVTGLPAAIRNLRSHPALFAEVDLALVTMGRGVEIVDLGGEGSFTPLPQVVLPDLTCDGVSELGRALRVSLDLLAEEVERLCAGGLTLKSPQMIVLTDGEPTNADGDPEDTAWREPLEELRERVRRKQLMCSAIGYRDARRDVLDAIAGHDAVHLGSLPIAQVIRVVSGSIRQGPEDDLSRFRRPG